MVRSTPQSVEQWDIFELCLDGPSEGNPFKDVSVKGRFSLEHRVVTVDGFYNGDGVYCVRFCPDTRGHWRFEIISDSDALNGHTGTFEVTEPTGANHGPVVVNGRHHFTYADGAWYSCIGTTSYDWINQGPELAAQTLATLEQSPFNKLRMALFPKSYLYNEHKEPERYVFPCVTRGKSGWQDHWECFGGTLEWEWDFERFDIAFFKMLDSHLRRLRDMNIEADIILFHPYDRWGFKDMDEQTDTFYLRYLIARISSFRNVWWSLANEFEIIRSKDMGRWERIGETIRRADPYHRLTSIHNATIKYDYNRPWITHASIQTHEFPIHRYMQDYHRPIVLDEIGYEGTVKEEWGMLSGRELVHLFWLVAVQGAYPGHSEVWQEEADDDVFWWNKGGVCKGESVPRIAFLKQILESGPQCGMTVQPAKSAFCFWGAKEERWYLGYTGHTQPRSMELPLKANTSYTLTLIDTWHMEKTVCADPVKTGDDGKAAFPLAGKPETAFLLRENA